MAPAVSLGRFTTERLTQGRQVLKTGFAPEVMEYAKKGVTDSLRPAVWRAILGLPKVQSKSATVERPRARERYVARLPLQEYCWCRSHPTIGVHQKFLSLSQ